MDRLGLIALIVIGLSTLLLMLMVGLVGMLLQFLAWAVDVVLAGLESLVEFLGDHVEELE